MLKKIVWNLISFILIGNIVRLYILVNFFVTKNQNILFDCIITLAKGTWFDLCVSGFILFPLAVMFFLEEKFKYRVSRFLQYLSNLYQVFIFIVMALLYSLNIPFFITNLNFGDPHWMRWEDYKSVFFIDCHYCYWHYDYLNQWYSLFWVVISVFILQLYSLVLSSKNEVAKVSVKRYIFTFCFLMLLARGKLTRHHIRYEDSIWHKEPLINELSNSPLWLLDKSNSNRNKN